MMETPDKTILDQPISNLPLSEELKGISEIFGFYTLGDLVQRRTRDIIRIPGFDENLIHEYVSFLEGKGLGHLIDPV